MTEWRSNMGNWSVGHCTPEERGCHPLRGVLPIQDTNCHCTGYHTSQTAFTLKASPTRSTCTHPH